MKLKIDHTHMCTTLSKWLGTASVMLNLSSIIPTLLGFFTQVHVALVHCNLLPLNMGFQNPCISKFFQLNIYRHFCNLDPHQLTLVYDVWSYSRFSKWWDSIKLKVWPMQEFHTFQILTCQNDLSQSRETLCSPTILVSCMSFYTCT